MRQPVAAIRTIGRATQGVKLVKLDGGTSISAITRVISEDTASSASSEPVETTDENKTIDVFEEKDGGSDE